MKKTTPLSRWIEEIVCIGAATPPQKHHLASSCQAPLLNLQTVQAPFLVNPPAVLVFHELPKN